MSSPKKSPRAKRPSLKKKVPPSSSRQLRLLLAALGVIGFLLISLILLTYVRQSRLAPPQPPTSPPVIVKPPVPVVPELTPTAPDGEDLRRLLSRSLTRRGYAGEGMRIEQDGGVTTYVLDASFPGSVALDALLEPLHGAAPEVRLETGSTPGLLLVLLGDRVVARLQFRPPVAPPAPVIPPSSVAPPSAVAPPPPVLPPPTSLSPLPVGKAGRVAIVMDDLGRDLASAQELLAIDLAVTCAIIPENEAAPQVAELAHRQGREVMMHMPMEPQGYPRVNPGADALLLRQSAEEIRALVRGYRQRVPYATGGNNHMGSRFTESREKMAVVLEELRREGLFFVDSRTSNRSVAYETARELGVATARRDIFLDNVRTVPAIRGEIRRMARMAAKNGEALAICHPYPETFAALRAEADALRAQGLSVVPASRLLVR